MYKLIVVQLLLSLVIGSVGWVYSGWVAGYSGLLGGLIYALPNLVFAKVVFADRPLRTSMTSARALYVGEAAKLVGVAMLFAAVFHWVRRLDSGVLFFAFILVMTTNTLAPALWGSHTFFRNRA